MARTSHTVTAPPSVTVNRSGVWSVGIESWRNAQRQQAVELLEDGLQLAQQLRDTRTAASYLEVLAWIAAEEGRQAQAAVMLAAAEKLGGATGNYAFLFPNLAAFHADCDQRIRSSIDAQAYETARRTGQSLRLDDAVAYALGEG